jgi:hypothetical protein
MLYINGVLDVTVANTTTSISTAGDIHIGASGGSNSGWDGNSVPNKCSKAFISFI